MGISVFQQRQVLLEQFFKGKLYLKNSMKLIIFFFAAANVKIFFVTRISGNKSTIMSYMYHQAHHVMLLVIFLLLYQFCFHPYTNLFLNLRIQCIVVGGCSLKYLASLIYTRYLTSFH